MFTFEHCEIEIKKIQKLLDTLHEFNDNKDVNKNTELKNYLTSLRSSCIALGNLRYKLLKVDK